MWKETYRFAERPIKSDEANSKHVAATVTTAMHVQYGIDNATLQQREEWRQKET